MAAESGQQREVRFAELAQEYQAKADYFRRQASNCAKGNEGERRVAELLDVLDGAGWRTLHDRYKAAGSRANIDHILVGPPGVCVIDAKNWSGGRLRLDERGMALGRWRKDDELFSAVTTATVVAEHVRAVVPTAITAPVLAFVADVGLAEPVYHQQVMVMQAGHLLTWLTSQPAALTSQQVHQIASTLDAALPPRSGPAEPYVLPPPRPARTRSPVPASRRPAQTAGEVARGELSLLAKKLLAVAVMFALAIVVGIPLVQKVAPALVSSLVTHSIPSPRPSSGAGAPAACRPKATTSSPAATGVCR